MLENRPITSRALLLGMLLIAGCAGSRAASGEPRVDTNSATLNVTRVPPVGSMTIYVVSNVGARRRVGYLSAGQDAEFQFSFPGIGSYQFMAETLSRATMYSNGVYLRPGMELVWDLTTNIALISE